MGLRAFGAVGDLGLSMFWSLGQTGLMTVVTKGQFEALGHMDYGIQHIWMHIYYSILCHTILYYAILFHIMPYYSINRDTPIFVNAGLKTVSMLLMQELGLYRTMPGSY